MSDLKHELFERANHLGTVSIHTTILKDGAADRMENVRCDIGMHFNWDGKDCPKYISFTAEDINEAVGQAIFHSEKWLEELIRRAQYLLGEGKESIITKALGVK